MLPDVPICYKNMLVITIYFLSTYTSYQNIIGYQHMLIINIHVLTTYTTSLICRYVHISVIFYMFKTYSLNARNYFSETNFYLETLI